MSQKEGDCGFRIKLAEIVIEIHALYAETKEFCREYLTGNDGELPAFPVTITPEDIQYEREKSAGEDLKEGHPVRHFSAPYLETLAVYRKIAERMPEYGVILFHGSAIALDGTGYLFAAKSGTGKSTHTSLWREQFGDRAVMVNDDKPLIKISEKGVFVCGTPWDGKHHLSSNISAPLKAVCLLGRGRQNKINEVRIQEAYPRLIQQVFRPSSPEQMQKVLMLLDVMLHQVRLFQMECNMESAAALTAYQGMNV